jgi:hypothetical protein
MAPHVRRGLYCILLIQAFFIQRLSSPQAAWSSDTAGTAFQIRGYEIDDNDRPTFLYSMYGAEIKDDIKVMDNAEGLRRTISINNAKETLHARIAVGKTIESIGNGMYLINDKTFYLRVDDAGKSQPVIRDANGGKELIVPVQTQLSYSILF